jgi:hypothetical protein
VGTFAYGRLFSNVLSVAAFSGFGLIMEAMLRDKQDERSASIWMRMAPDA